MGKIDKTLETLWKKYYTDAVSSEQEDHVIYCATSAGVESYTKYFYENFKEHLDLGKGKEVLDIGCGLGVFPSFLSDAGFKVTAVDYVPEMVQVAKKRMRDKPIQFRVADIYALPFPDNSFDYVTCFGVFQNLSEPSNALKEMFRVLKPGGVMAMTTLNALSLHYLLRKKKEIVPTLRYRPSEMRLLVANAGFDSIKEKGIYAFPSRMATDLFLKYHMHTVFNAVFRIGLLVSHSFYLEARKPK